MDKILEEEIRKIIKQEIKKAEKRKEAEEIRKDPSAYHKLHREVD